MDASELKEILEQHKLWIDTNGKQGQRANLSGANLYRAYITGAKLEFANLNGANLEGANLWDENLTGAKLTGAKLTGANLINAILYSANLRGANLLGANLTRADLTRASLNGANLNGANLNGANLNGANLTGITGLHDISCIIPGCLVQLNKIRYTGFYLEKENKYENFIQDSFGFFIQDNPEEGTFDMLLGDRIIRNIPYWVKYSGLKPVE